MIKHLLIGLTVLSCSVKAQEKAKFFTRPSANTENAKILLMPIPASTLYSFSTFTAPYQPIVGTSLSNGLKWDETEHSVPLGFNFNLYNKTVSTLTINGGSYITDDNTSNLLTAASPFFEDLCDRAYTTASNEGDPGGVSPITYTITGTPGNRIALIQVSNAGFYGEVSTSTVSNTSFTNFQIWLYETTNVIEFRYGPTNVSNLASNFVAGTQGFVCGLFEDWDFSNNPPNSNMLNGNVSAPAQTGFDLSSLPLFTSVPTLTNQNNLNGRVYRFTYNGLTTGIKTNDPNNAFSVYPNPAKDVITVKSNVANTIRQISICDINGRVITTENSESVTLTGFNTGMYILKIETDQGTFFKKITKSE